MVISVLSESYHKFEFACNQYYNSHTKEKRRKLLAMTAALNTLMFFS